MTDWADEIADKEFWDIENERCIHPGIATALRRAKADGYREAAAMGHTIMGKFDMSDDYKARREKVFDYLNAHADKIEKGEGNEN